MKEPTEVQKKRALNGLLETTLRHSDWTEYFLASWTIDSRTMKSKVVKTCLDSFVKESPSVSWVLRAKIGPPGEGYRINLDYRKEVEKYLGIIH